MKKTAISSNKDADTIVITEAFIPLFFEQLTIAIPNRNPILIKKSLQWNLIEGFSQEIVDRIDHPPEHYPTT